LKPKPKVIFFDIGQTLVTGAEQSPHKLLCSRLGLDPECSPAVGRLLMTHRAEEPDPLVEALCGILPGTEPGRIAREIRQLWREQLESAREIDGAAALLGSLRELGIRLGVISNIWHPFYQGLAQRRPSLVETLDYKILSYRKGLMKPSTELYREALEACGEPPQDCWMVGDTYELDVAPAMHLGMRTVWVLNRPEKEKVSLVGVLRGEKPSPDWVTGDLGEVERFFSRKG